jgi:gamma-glutamylcyclotransferase (GGCT)/AIG2-like uncharacterized protein YtfP
MKLALFYGSLKKREFNFDRFGAGTQKFIKTVELDGYDLYDLKYYPGLTKGKGRVTFELHEVDDRAFDSISRMEAGAGYSLGEEKVDGKEAAVFFYEGDLSEYKKIESGNWNG